MPGDGTVCERGFGLLNKQGAVCRTIVLRQEIILRLLLLWSCSFFTRSREGASVGRTSWIEVNTPSSGSARLRMSPSRAHRCKYQAPVASHRAAPDRGISRRDTSCEHPSHNHACPSQLDNRQPVRLTSLPQQCAPPDLNRPLRGHCASSPPGVHGTRFAPGCRSGAPKPIPRNQSFLGG